MKRLVLSFFMTFFLYSLIFAAFEKGAIQHPGAVAAGVGYACTAKSAGADSVFHNPASLFIAESSGLSLMYGNIANTKAQDAYGVLYGYIKPYLSVAASAGKMYRENTGEYTYQLTLSVPLYRDDLQYFGAGCNVKYLVSSYGGQASALTADIGALSVFKDVWFLEHLSLGAVYKDINARLRHENGLEEKIASSLSAGIALGYEGFELSGDFDYIMDISADSYNYSVGLSKKLLMFTLRTGFAGFQTIAPAFTAGAGITLGDFTVDYAFVGHTSSLGATHRIEALYLFDRVQTGYIPAPVKCAIYSGDTKALVKWSSLSGRITRYRLYITPENQQTITRETEGRSDIDFLITGLENGTKYTVQISAFSGDKESEKSDVLAVKPSVTNDKAKTFYKKAELLYIDGKYKAAIDTLKQAGTSALLTAEYVILMEKLEKLRKIK